MEAWGLGGFQNFGGRTGHNLPQKRRSERLGFLGLKQPFHPKTKEVVGLGSEPGPGTSRDQRRLGETAVTGGVLEQEETAEAGRGESAVSPTRQITGDLGLARMHVPPHPFFPRRSLCSLLGKARGTSREPVSWGENGC